MGATTRTRPSVVPPPDFMATIVAPVTNGQPSPVRFAGLLASVANWDMIQETRIKVELPLKAVQRAGAYPPAWLEDVLGRLNAAEVEAEKRILAEWKNHPLSDWASSVRGLGAHSAAVLVAYVDGDPFIAYPKAWVGGRGSARVEALEPFERNLSQLWRYCGYGAPDKREKGMGQDELLGMGKPRAKARCRLIAEALLKAANEEARAVYDDARLRYAERVHESSCAQCGGKGPAAKAGTPWRPGHQHGAALRLIVKRYLLTELWLESRRLHREDAW